MTRLPPSPFAARVIDPSAIVGALRRRRWLAGTLLGVALAITGTLTAFLPDRYAAKAVLLVERQQVPAEYVRSTVTAEFDRRLHTISQTILSRSTLTGLLQKFGLYPELREQLPMESIVEKLRADIVVELIRGERRSGGPSATAFSISYHGRDPRTVAAVTNDLAAMYIDEDLKMRERHAAGTTNFLSRQLEQELKKKLEDQEKAVREFKEKHLGQLPQQEAANLAALERLNGQLLLNGERQAQLRVERESLRTAMLAGGGGGSGPEALAARLASRRAELAELRKRFTDKYPDVIHLKGEIAALEQQLATGSGEVSESGATSFVDGTDATLSLRRVDTELAGLRAEGENLRRVMAEYQERVENTPRRQQEFQALSRDYETTQEIYQSLLKRYEEARLAESMEHHQKGEQFRLLDPAVIPEEPTAPNRPLLLLAGFLTAIALAVGVVIGFDWLDSSFHSIDDLRDEIEVPVLLSIRRVVTSNDRLRAARVSILRAGGATALVAIAVIGSYALARDNTWLVRLLF